ncbi:endonuclease VIII [Rhodohalobacter sp.]|uniref:endonuclease VIII n=1 Tax=Rhodohalobacter sp. TaxID=1974210 RepID=UPI002ACEFE29|nr:endonuclease VIII [Rhodohalobacter sp.]MDZ7755929.1 endonuclease VIII [Rhodohalobacter sp.]
MPEGPEVHREADKIRNAIGDQSPIYLYFYHDHLKPFESDLAGKQVENVEAYGKGLVISFEDDYHIYSHNQLYGKWYIKPAGDYPKTNRELRLEIRTDRKSALLYSASDIDVMDEVSLHEHPYLSKLGPDLLKGVQPETIAERTVDDQFRRKSFASLLLNQGFLSGVGNYLRTEILYDARIHPKKRPMDLSDEAIETFSKSALTITGRSYETGGLTTPDDLAMKLKSEGKKRRDYRHFLFGRENKPCHICGNIIQKTKMSGRRIYICESCQEK